ncbi:hypothetical protein [Haloarchaeobius sp. TZWWS8]|uniref:hypothetical protein n=1 Tax=Haloarchaeobius sp. TZWWS8 TaxID=3446121 RepID=UPI003EB8190E
MTNKTSNSISRRQVLAGLGTIGVASAGAGLGTTAFFGDTERLSGWYEAGRVDLILDYRSTYKPWERYDLQMVPEDQRPAIVADTMGMTYEVGAAPAIRNTETGEALSHEQWGRLVTGLTDVPVACDFDDPTDISGSLPDGFETVSDGTYRPGYIDGQDNGDSTKTAMFVDLDDIKPYDEGETTFSLHLCGNPSYLTARLLESMDLENPDGSEDPIEPEREAGEPAVGDRDADLEAIWNGGELGDYMYVIVSTDPDCDNLTLNDILAAPDEDDLGDEQDVDIDPDFGVIRENVLYAGSLKGWIQLLDDGFELPPSGAGGTGGATNGVQIQAVNGDSTTVVAQYCGAFSPGAQAQQCLGCFDDDCEVVGEVTDLSGFCYTGDIPADATHVTLKAANGCYLAALESDTEEVCMPDDPGVGANQYGEISNATFYKCDDGPDFPPSGEPSPGDCFKPGAHCYVLEWYLPCREVDEVGRGFRELPIYNAIDRDGNPIEEQDEDGEGVDGANRLSFNDELRQRGFVTENDETIDVNVAQTDSCHFTIEFEAEQCRHNSRPNGSSIPA